MAEIDNNTEKYKFIHSVARFSDNNAHLVEFLIEDSQNRRFVHFISLLRRISVILKMPVCHSNLMDYVDLREPRPMVLYHTSLGYTFQYIS